MDFKNLKGFIFDIDGTLYSQKKMRFRMLVWLLLYYFLRPLRLWEPYAVFLFRKLRERNDWKQASFEKLYQEIEKRVRRSAEQIEKCVRYWMFEAPLDILRKCTYQDVVSFVNTQHQEGKKIIIYSDYPGEDKLKVIEVEYDLLYDYGQNGIKEQKPSINIMKKILSESGLLSNELLYVGDRNDRDRLSADLVRMPYCDIKVFRRLIL